MVKIRACSRWFNKKSPDEAGRKEFTMPDFLPTKDVDFNQWFKDFVQYVNLKCHAVPPATTPDWTHIPAARLTELVNSYADWYTFYVVTLKPHSPAETLAKNEARGVPRGRGGQLGHPGSHHPL
jgi:hypothetical protein